MNLTDEQKKQITQAFITAIVTLVLSIVSILGYQVALKPMLEPAAPMGALGLGGVQPATTFKALTVQNGLTVGGSLTAQSLITQTDNIQVGNGTADAPAMSFTADTDTGVYRVGANNLGISAAATKVFDCTGAGCTTTGVNTTSGNLAVAAPTAIASATPAARINNLGANNDALSIEKAGTPVFKVSNSGAITGNVLQYGASGQKIVCGSTVITGTGAIAHGLATPSYVTYSMAQDATGDGARLSHTNITATVTLKAWNTALTPAPATTPVTTNWCVVGSP